MLGKFKLIDKAPQWFSMIDVKPQYRNDEYSVNWDIPEFSGRDGETIRDSARPDGKLVMKNEKKIYLIEQTIPWIGNRDATHMISRQCIMVTFKYSYVWRTRVSKLTKSH